MLRKIPGPLPLAEIKKNYICCPDVTRLFGAYIFKCGFHELRLAACNIYVET